MATQNARVERMQPYNHPAYNKQRRISADDRRTREQSDRRSTRAQRQTTTTTRPTTNQIFNTQYQQTGERPGGVNVNAPDRTQNTQATYRTSNAPVRSAKSTDEIFNESYQKAGIQPANENRAPDKTNKAKVTYATSPNTSQVPRISQTRIPRIKRKKKVSTAKYVARKTRATAANAWITAWASWWYLGFQLPVAVVGNFALGVWFAAGYIVTQFKETKTGETITFVLGESKFNTIAEGVADYILKTFGLNFDPEILFIIPFALTFLLGLFQLICCGFTYVAMGLKPLSGKGAWLKLFTFLFVMIGYGIPILNLFPLVYLWSMTVWAYPR